MSVICMEDQVEELLHLGVLFGSYRVSVDDADESNLVKSRVCFVEFIEELEPQLLVNWIASFSSNSEGGVIVSFDEVYGDREKERERIQCPIRIYPALANSIVRNVLNVDCEIADNIIKDFMPHNNTIESSEEFAKFWKYIVREDGSDGD